MAPTARFYDDDRVASPAMEAIHQVYDSQDAVVAGTSAGCAAITSAVMVMGK